MKLLTGSLAAALVSTYAAAEYIQSKSYALRSIEHDDVLLSHEVSSIRRLLGDTANVVQETPESVHFSFAHGSEEFDVVLHRELSAVTSATTRITTYHADGTITAEPAADHHVYKSENKLWTLSFVTEDKIDGLFRDLDNERVFHFRTNEGKLEVNSDAHDFYEGALFDLQAQKERQLQSGIVYWDNCYPNQESAVRDFVIGFAVGSRLVNTLGGASNVAPFIASIVADSNEIYLPQMNLRLAVGEIAIATANSNLPWDNPSCTADISDQLYAIQGWRDRPATQGTWHVLDDCFGSSGNTLGIAKVGVLCRSSVNVGVSYYTDRPQYINTYPTWATFAHEEGHNFNAQHSFENGQGSTGGIMDYGTLRQRLINGVMQFNTQYRKREVCSELTRVANCRFFQPLTTPPPTNSPTPDPTPLPTPNPTPAPTPQPTRLPTTSTQTTTPAPTPATTNSPTPNPTPQPTSGSNASGIQSCQKFTNRVRIGTADVSVGAYTNGMTPERCYQKCQETQGCKSFVTSASLRYCELWGSSLTASTLEAYENYDTYICPAVSDGNPATDDTATELQCNIHRNRVLPGVANIYSGSFNRLWTEERCAAACEQTAGCRTFTFSRINRYCELWDASVSAADLVALANYDTMICAEPENFEADEEEDKSVDDLLSNANVQALVQSCCSVASDKYYLGRNTLYLEDASAEECQKICVEDTTCHSFTFDPSASTCEFWEAKSENETRSQDGVVTTDCNRLCIANAVRPDIENEGIDPVTFIIAGGALAVFAVVAVVGFLIFRNKKTTAAATGNALGVQGAEYEAKMTDSVRNPVFAMEEQGVPVPQARGAMHYKSGGGAGMGYSSAPPGYRG